MECTAADMIVRNMIAKNAVNRKSEGTLCTL